MTTSTARTGRQGPPAAPATAPPLVSTPVPRRRRASRLGSGDAIIEAATRLFLEKGYQGASMDEIAAVAGVSKQTIYTHFANKEELFTRLVLGNAERVDTFVAELPAIVHDADDLAGGLDALARRYLRFVVRPEVLRLRRLVIGEASRFPELAQAYFEAVPARVYAALSELFASLDGEGLHVPDPVLAAQHFAWLLLGGPLDRGMFVVDDEPAGDAELERLAREGVRAFLSAYAPA
jgi:TetR/AcrR family transcriptional regulator, mexJK operon transcriptional repressor